MRGQPRKDIVELRIRDVARIRLTTRGRYNPALRLPYGSIGL